MGCAQEGKIPKLEAILDESESEEEPDATLEIPANKIKLMVGPGGERIKLIQRKSKCRIQARPAPYKYGLLRVSYSVSLFW